VTSRLGSGCHDEIDAGIALFNRMIERTDHGAHLDAQTMRSIDDFRWRRPEGTHHQFDRVFECDFEQFLGVLDRRFRRLPGLHVGGYFGLFGRQWGDVVLSHDGFGPCVNGSRNWLRAA
jgi:hypothetical protein